MSGGQNPTGQRVLVLDFGSQYSQLIARRIREIGVYSELHSWDISPQKLRELAPQAVILSGGPESLADNEKSPGLEALMELSVPVLGICYGMQLMIQLLGGTVHNASKHEYGLADLTLTTDSPLLPLSSGNNLSVWMSHGDSISSLPPGCQLLASSTNSKAAAIGFPERRWYGLQFHPEVTHTQGGTDIIRRFVCDIAGCDTGWTSANILQEAIEKVQSQVAGNRVLLALSGGVDSSVAAALLQRAVGDQLQCVFVDNGLLRQNEATQVITTFKNHMGIKLIAVDASQRFYKALQGVTDPEQKRRIIGNTFIDVFDEESAKLGEIQFLAQGTIYPDVIESAAASTGKAKLIKSHHNVGGLPEHMNMQLVEPLRNLFKDEVRAIGKELDLPDEILMRHPFPGPGLGVRTLGEIIPADLEKLRCADAIFIEELRKHAQYDKVSQAFAVLLPVKSVGVTGDNRRYEPVIALRAVVTSDFMTAHAAPLSHDLLGHVSRRIVNEVPGISRVVYDISDKPPATIEWE